MQDNPNTQPQLHMGLTQGDINGIAYEIILKSFGDSRMLSELTPILYGQSKVLSYYKKNFGIEDFNYSLTRDARQAWNQKFNIINIVDYELKIDPGKVTDVSAEMAVMSLKLAVEDLKNDYIDALVMSPACHSVDCTQAAFLSASFGKPEMLRVLVSDRLRMGLVTDDIPLREAVSQLSSELIVRKIVTLSQALKRDFGLNGPKIAVMGLDPHSGEMDSNDANDIVLPAVAEAQRMGVFAFGPFSASRLFTTGAWKKYDAILALTYDQGVLPFRILTLEGAAYYWAGLPAVCTAPIHGPAFDIANTKKASPDSFRRAVYLALDIVGHRKE